MRIDILVPVTVDIWNDGILKKALECKSPDTELVISSLTEGIDSIECDYDAAIASMPTILKAVELEKAGSQAVIIYCFTEPALAAIKEKLDIPVLGIRECSIALATVMGNKLGIIAPIANSVPSYFREVGNKVERIISMDLPVLDYLDYEKVESCIEENTGKLIAEGCDVILLGCGSVLGIDFDRIQAKYGVPIIIPLTAAISSAEFMVRNGLCQSKITYPNPPKK